MTDLKNQIVSLKRKNPQMTIRQIGALVGAGREKVGKTLIAAGFGHDRGKMKRKILELREAHPDWTTRKITKAVGCTESYTMEVLAPVKNEHPNHAKISVPKFETYQLPKPRWNSSIRTYDLRRDLIGVDGKPAEIIGASVLGRDGEDKTGRRKALRDALDLRRARSPLSPEQYPHTKMTPKAREASGE